MFRVVYGAFQSQRISTEKSTNQRQFPRIFDEFGRFRHIRRIQNVKLQRLWEDFNKI